MQRKGLEWLMLALFVLFTMAASLGSPALASENDELAARVDILAEELAALREAMAIPSADDALGSAYGMGPAASKVYGGAEGIAMGGYGEFYFADQRNGANTADFYRFIAYLGYKFSDRIVMNTEIEFEHATTSKNHAGKAGSVSVEFAYLDFLLDPRFNVRTGNLLVPMGFINEMHEPPFYRGNFRPETERRIIPSTWRELGVGAHGTFGENFRYTAYILNGLNGSKFSSKGIRDGRQKGNQALWNDVGIVAATQHSGSWHDVGVSGYYGGSDQDMIFEQGDPVNVENWIVEAHASMRAHGFEFRGLFARSGIEGAEKISTSVPSAQQGGYLELAYDLAPHVISTQSSVRLEPWLRFEDYDLNHEMPIGSSANPARSVRSTTIGLNFLPDPQVVLKAEWSHEVDGNDATTESVRVGAGYVF